MKKNSCFSIAIILGIIALSNCIADTVDLTEPMKESLVYLDISNAAYDQYQPWKQTPISKEGGYGCAVGPYEILTTAENVMNATFVQARCYAQNEYIPVTIKIVDYELNLCLLEIDKNAVEKPLTPLSFKEIYPKGKMISSYWLSSGGHLTNARSTLDRAEMQYSDISFVRNLYFLVTNVSRPFGDGEVCSFENDTIGIAAWGTDSDSGIIPAETINKFLSHSKEDTYNGFGPVGFETYELLDPTMRKYLKMPDDIKHGIYVSDVHTLGTGCKELKPKDVILSIDGHDINPYGRYLHDQYDRISFQHILLTRKNGDMIPFEIFRDGKKTNISVQARNFAANDMMIPYYQYKKKPEYIVIGGYVFMKLTKDYLTMWGEDWAGKVPPHLYYYYREKSFKPTEERKEVIVLSYVLPAEINLGYQQLSRLVVSSVNGKKVTDFQDILDAYSNTADSEFIVFEFEMNSPTLVIPKAELNMANMFISQVYGIPKMQHIEE